KDPSAIEVGETKDAAKSEDKPKPKSAEEIEKEVAELNGRLSKWVYQIPSYNKSSFEKKKSELLKGKTPPAPPEPSKEETVPGTEAPRTPPDPSKPPETNPEKP